ncbi:ATPase [Vibrio phage 1.097.O._10N.286.49.B3]|uniref:P-loop containing nucleoside triphosphate hydrolase n=1 Tax=Vibrio phage 1.097.O._10N.286.49.B3 TaxID=1881383 RepID=A0A2I7R0Q0_9CAUD|nr:ATPase [Vibrio phage 1.097.O._10N.286.49.B3]AUR87224.1 P-loop containing nucleoside triphosphate hydrolase [Vibrio phage 1.097.O._10N.286.49.B3]
MQVSLKSSSKFVVNSLKAGLVPYVAGAPGIGKSDMVRQVAKAMNLKVIDHRLSTSDPTDLSGLPAIVNGSATFTPFDLFPIEGTDIPAGFDGWLLFLDELPSAPMSVQAAAYKLALDKEVGQHKLHENVHVVCAGNRKNDGAIVNKIGTAMQSRLVHFEIETEGGEEEWLAWAYGAGIDPRVTSYIAFAPDKLHEFDPNHHDKTFPCPRTWEFMSRYGKANDLTAEHMPAMAGIIGEGPARAFLGYCELGSKLPSFAQILAKPDTLDVPDEPSALYFTCGTIASKTEPADLAKIVKYVERMSMEFQIICFRDMFKRTPAVKKDPVMRKWIVQNAKYLFADD